MHLFSAPDDREEPLTGTLLRDVSKRLVPESDVRELIKKRVQRRIEPAAILNARDLLTPSDTEKARIRQRMLSRLSPLHTLWERLRSLSSPGADVQLYMKRKMYLRLLPSAIPFRFRFLRVAAMSAILLLVVRLGPSLFLAPQTIADSFVLLVPQGEVSVLRDGLWQPLAYEVALQKGAEVRTGEGGAATLIVRLEGVVRLDEKTTLRVPDFSSHTTSVAVDPPEFTLTEGRIWAQGLMPPTVNPGWRFAVADGTLALNEASVSIEERDGKTSFEVWNRSTKVGSESKDLVLVSGEGVVLTGGRFAAVGTLNDQSSWAESNLQRDAVHRREIAQEQHERRARSAGILPTSVLYPVKRVAEAMDVLMTFGEDARAQKLLGQANTRLNEAAALLSNGTGAATAAAEAPLQEYKSTLLAVATGSGQNFDVQAMVQEQLTSEVADVAAALPGDASYPLKQMVLEATAEVPDSTVKPADVEGAVLVDTLASLNRRAQEGDAAAAVKDFLSVSGSLVLLDDANSQISPELRKEARASLTLLAKALEEEKEEGSSGSLLLTSGLERYLPIPVAAQTTVPLTDGEVESIAQAIKSRIFLFKMPRSRYDQLLTESRALDGHPDQGRILRHLYYILPQEGLAQYVRTEFARIRKK